MGQNSEEIVIEPYDPDWPRRYKKEIKIIKRALQDKNIVRFEHFGSTAIPNLAAKPIIDIMIVVRSLEQARSYIPKLEKIGYAYWSENPKKDRFFFAKGLPPNGPRSHHIHLTKLGGKVHDRLHFRDYLREHPDEARAYERLKYELAGAHRTDREAYTDAKEGYVKRVTKKAKGYYAKPKERR